MKGTHKVIYPIAVMTLAGTLLVGYGNGRPAHNAAANETNSALAGQPVDGGTFTFSVSSDIVTLNPLFTNDVPSGDCEQFIYSPIYSIDRKGNLVNDAYSLADQPLNVSDDGLRYTIHLRKNAKWSDGQPVTADDVVFTINALKNPDVGSPGITNYDPVKEVKKLDDNTVEIDMKHVYAPFALNALWAPVLPAHILKDVPAKQLQKNAYGTDPSKTVSDGPWKWTEWKQKQYLKFEADPNYFGPKPHIQDIVCKVYADQNTELQGLLKGDVDEDDEVPVTALDAVKAKHKIHLLTGAGPSYEYIGFNFNASNFPNNFDPFTGDKTRQAIAYALNRQAMVDKILKGTGKLQNGPFLPGSWSDPGDAATNYNYDPNKAKALLQDDGWKSGPDGILQKDGHRFSFELIYNANNSRRQQVAAVVQQELKNVGIECKPKGIDFSAEIDQNLNHGKFQAVLIGWQWNLDPDSESIFSSKYFPPNGQNAGWYQNSEIDKLWVEGDSTIDQAKRKEVYKEIAQKITQDLPYVFMYQVGDPTGFSSKVHWAPDDAPNLALPYGYLFHIQNWWVGTH
ncbi:ABC transporter substrate-binding protein [Alicyclobacillus pomorum]|uniref:ABC transporter substrate-binding protein n=1 Tax=Alicyclobacillus pomorum TaxID=204470 RepID=UPI0004096F78|nr:ABC transporter substrate-binding protein [Alicyclobacillus pomorum]